MSNKVRWGILGAGWIATRFAADLRYSATGLLSRVASRDTERAAVLAKPYQAQVSETYEALVTASDVDAIYIATPARLHRDHCLLALAHGKPVLCEKPFATCASEAREIQDAARSAGVFCMEAMWTRFLPVVTELRRRIAEGGLGAVSQFGAELGFPVAETDATAAITSPALGGGALLDLGIYGISLAHDLLGVPDAVEARALRSDTGSIRDVCVILRHGGGAKPALSSIRASHATQLRNMMDVAGSQGAISVQAPFIQAERASFTSVKVDTRAAETPSAFKDFMRSTPLWPMARKLVHSARKQSFGRPYRGYGLHFQTDEVGRCLAQGQRESSIMPLSSSVDVLETVDAVASRIHTLDP